METQNKKFSELMEALEHISEDQYGMLVGGFAAMAMQADDSNLFCGKTSNTNCDGGNCVAGCGGPKTQ